MVDEFSEFLFPPEKETPKKAEPAAPIKVHPRDDVMLPIPIRDQHGRIIRHEVRKLSKCSGKEFVSWCKEVLPIPGYPGVDSSFFDDLKRRQQAFKGIVSMHSRKLMSTEPPKERFIN